jgi:hypothetical protein
MTNWGYLLIVAYVGLGVSSVPRAKAVALALVITTMVLGFALVRMAVAG